MFLPVNFFSSVHAYLTLVNYVPIAVPKQAISKVRGRSKNDP
jgi:hypothetical protein